ncbi:MAG TPA: ABC transporter substrate-binding protein [Bradyrhizobium sp.]|nr:ABC transporter substrate-binding protein [Bradyrhizobium sp.]
MKRRDFIVALGGAAATWPLRAQQPPGTVIGLLTSTNLADWTTDAIRAGLQEQGYAEGRNLTVILRSADGHFERLPELAADIVNSQVALIFATGSPVPARVAKAATVKIPIVFAYGGDPIADGLVESLNKPGGNVTGATFIGSALLAKRMELLRQVVPEVTDVALLVNPKGTLAERQIKDAMTAAERLNQRVHVLNMSTLSEIDTAFEAMKGLKIGAYIVSTDPFFGFIGQKRLIELAVRYKLPGIFNAREEAGAGGLMSYGPVLADTWRQAGVYAGRILKGEKPSELPVMQPTRFQTVINLKVAKELGLTIPPSVLTLADEVIE